MLGFDETILRQPKRDLVLKILIALIGDALIGFGISLNTCAGLGHNPTAAFMDGIRKLFDIDFGLTFNFVNLIMFFVVFIFARQYVNIGTAINAISLGYFVNLAEKFYAHFTFPETLAFKGIAAFVACTLLFFGIASFSSVEIGFDPWTGFVMLLKDKVRFNYKLCLLVINVILALVGFFLGGSVGGTTLVVIFFASPIIESFANFIKKSILSKFNFKNN